jgi:hypothetical protein
VRGFRRTSGDDDADRDLDRDFFFFAGDDDFLAGDGDDSFFGRTFLGIRGVDDDIAVGSDGRESRPRRRRSRPGRFKSDLSGQGKASTGWKLSAIEVSRGVLRLPLLVRLTPPHS